MGLDLKNLAQALGGDVSRDQVLAPGPGHSRQDRSLSITLSTATVDGFVVHSFAGDDPIICKDHVRQKLGVAAFKPKRHPGATEAAIDQVLRAAVAGQQRQTGGAVVAKYDYQDSDGTLLYQVVRLEPKSFRHRKPDGNDGWIWQGSERRVPYRWPDLIKYPDATVFVCEGEKDADRVASLGHCATTVASHEWTDECVKALAGRDCWIVEDNDDPGLKLATEAAQALCGTAKSIRIVSLPGLGPRLPRNGKDISDWLDAGHSNEELIAVCCAAPAWSPRATEFAEAFTAEALNGMVFEPIKYVVEGFIAEGLTLFAGKPKIGKSWLLLHLAHEVADGGFTLGGVSCQAGDVLYAALEDNKRRLQRRMTKLFGTGRWPARLRFTCEMPKLADGGIQYIKNWIANAKCPRLVIIDTLAMVRSPSRKDQSTYDADYAAVKELRDLAAAHDIAIIIVHHLRKADADDPFDTISGTLGLTGCPDSILIIWREGNGVLLAAKGRDIEEIKKAVQFDAKTCVWTIIGDADVVKRSAEQSAIIKALEEANGEPLGPQQIAAATGMKAGNVRFLMSKMKVEGTIRTASYGKYVLATTGKAEED